MRGWHVLITGGSAGIGLATAELLAAKGFQIHLTGRSPEALARVRDNLGRDVYTYAGDIGKAEDRKELITRVRQNSGGRLDALVINAARYGFQSLTDMSLSSVEAYFQTNTIGSWHLMKLAYPLLQAGEGKAVVMVSSTLGSRPIAGTGAYAASKAALNSLTQTFALEWAGEGIRVNAVLPGVVDTNIHEPQSENDPTKAEKFAQVGPMHPMGRVGQAQEVATAIDFLLGSSSSWTTGSLFFVDGGISLV